MHGIEAVLGAIVRGRADRPGAARRLPRPDLASWADAPPGERETGIARDVIVIHLGAQSNLYAALAWTIVNLLLHPEALARVRRGDDAFLERCAYESIRLAQRSLTLRQVLRPLELDDGADEVRARAGRPHRDDALGHEPDRGRRP